MADTAERLPGLKWNGNAPAHGIPRDAPDNRLKEDLRLTSLSNMQLSLPTASSISLIDTLESAAAGNGYIDFYGDDTSSHACRRTTYKELWSSSTSKARVLLAIPELRDNDIILLHFDRQLDTIEWFWAVLLAGHLPAISTPLVPDPRVRNAHLAHLETLLNKPLVLTSQSLIHELQDVTSLRVRPVETLSTCSTKAALPETKGSGTDAAVLMLTSGSSGNAKAVVLRHEQIVRAVLAKSSFHGTGPNDVFLSWVGMDHVANFTEIFFQALVIGANQVQVQQSHISAAPVALLELIHRHRVSYTFAPNSFLAKLSQAVDNDSLHLDFSCLRRFISGGEANRVQTAVELLKKLTPFGLPRNAISPGFGMTETCAGSIYSKDFPATDADLGLEFGSVGTPTEALEMRVADPVPTTSGAMVGSLQVNGPALFTEYYQNKQATEESFTADGWFITGDEAYIDCNGRLNLTGRTKESIIIHGKNYYPSEIEASLEADGRIPGIITSYSAAFAWRPEGSETESYVVLYVPSFDSSDIDTRAATHEAITAVAGALVSSPPHCIIPVPKSMLHKSTLGKLSRAKLRLRFENGDFNEFRDENERILKEHRGARRILPTTDLEVFLIQQCASVLDIDPSDIGTQDTLWGIGLSSIDLFAIRRRLSEKLSIDVPMIALIGDPVIKNIAEAAEGLCVPHEYNPVIPIQPRGSKTPMWFVHPGSGDVLVFAAIAKHFRDRPVYGLRTRGFNEGEDYFTSMHEAATTYLAHVKKHQPHGPYALGGYSLGSTIAFELAKLLEAEGDEVKFLGLFDSPPHIASLTAYTDWVAVAYNVGYFLGLMPEQATAITGVSNEASEEEILDHVLAQAPKERLQALQMDRAKLLQIVSITNAFRIAAKSYECVGSVSKMDIFYVDPLQAVSPSREDWLQNFLKQWEQFCGEIRYHECVGDHARMFNEEWATSLYRILAGVLVKRGL